MKRSNFFAPFAVWLLLISLCWSRSGFGMLVPWQESTASVDAVVGLIQQLSYADPQARDLAEQKLIAWGGAVVPELKQALLNNELVSDNEARLRLERVLGAIQSRSVQSQHAAFVAGQASTQLPLWDHFAELVGESQASRRLFLLCHNHQAEFMKQLAKPDTELAAMYRDIVRQIQPGYQSSEGVVSSLSVSLLAVVAQSAQGTMLGMDMLDIRKTQLALVHAQTPDLIRSLKVEAPMKELISKWLYKIAPSKGAESRIHGDWLRVAGRYKVGKSVEKARDWCRQKDLSLSVRLQALSLIENLAPRDGSFDWSSIETLLGDQTHVATFFVLGDGGRIETAQSLLCDQAYQVLAQLNGQETSQFLRSFQLKNTRTVFPARLYGFVSDKSRKVAFEAIK